MIDEYSRKLLSLAGKLIEKNEKSLEKAAEKLSFVIEGGGLINMFGCGHSHLIALDCFYRAGGLACIKPVLKPELMLHLSASESSKLEKSENSVKGLFDDASLKKNDALVVISTSGINGAPVEAAIEGKEKGAFVIGVGSSEYNDVKSRHSSHKRLKDVCDVFLDNLAPRGDALVNLTDTVKTGPSSTVLSSFIVQDLLVRAEKKCVSRGYVPHVFGSGNLKENADRNDALVRLYKNRVKEL